MPVFQTYQKCQQDTNFLFNFDKTLGNIVPELNFLLITRVERITKSFMTVSQPARGYHDIDQYYLRPNFFTRLTY